MKEERRRFLFTILEISKRIIIGSREILMKFVKKRRKERKKKGNDEQEIRKTEETGVKR